VPVAGGVAFRFAPAAGGVVVQSLQELIDVLARTPTESIGEHIRRGDLSRWIGNVFRDTMLAREVADLEERSRLGALPDFNGAVIHAVHRRYHVVDDLR
jgi:hypothetical protein